MKVLNLGSLNYDYVYSLDHIVHPGETIASKKMEIFCGGKGLNQSIALANAGAEVSHAGMVGEDGEILYSMLSSYGVNTGLIKQVPGKSGHAIIQVEESGQNAILLYGGSNRCITKEYVDHVLEAFGSDDLLLLQNEVNLLPYMIDKAYSKGMKIALNPSPFDAQLLECDLTKVTYLLLNEVEGEQFTNEKESEQILNQLSQRYPELIIILTLGEKGAFYQFGEERWYQPALRVPVVDTTAAGDTFTGYFLASHLEGKTAKEALLFATKASSITVGRMGAAISIPKKVEVL